MTSDHHQGLERCYVEWQLIKFHSTPSHDKKLWSPLEVMSERVLYLAVSGNRENYLGTWGQSLKENIKEKSKINVESEITLTDTYFRLCFTHSLT